jgi:hypothetical protein
VVVGDAEALHNSGPAGVEYVEQVAVHGDTGRKLAARWDDRFELESVTVHAERRQRVASSVDREQQVSYCVVDE